MRNFLFIGALLLSSLAQAQSKSGSELNYKEIDNIEAVLENNIPQLDQSSDSKGYTPPIPKTQKADFTGLDASTLYSDLAVIQKNYMPKSGRIQLMAGLVTVPTDVFYLTGGLSLKALYHFSEAWGIEAFTHILSSSARPEIDNIANNQNVSVKNLVSLKSFSGANLYYNFMYGKLSVTDTKVVPFEIFNTVGGGTMVNSQDYQSTSVQVGIGTLLSLSRSSALRLDLNWAFYQTKNILDETVSENSTFLTLGYSWFFPEPEYR